MIETITMLDLTTIMASTGTTGTTLMTGDGTTITYGTTIIAIGLIILGVIAYLLDRKSFLNLDQELDQNQKNQESE